MVTPSFLGAQASSPGEYPTKDHRPIILTVPGLGEIELGNRVVGPKELDLQAKAQEAWTSRIDGETGSHDRSLCQKRLHFPALAV